jgi:hypothetical protein
MVYWDQEMGGIGDYHDREYADKSCSCDDRATAIGHGPVGFTPPGFSRHFAPP